MALCFKPFRAGVQEFRCGSCVSCLNYRKGVWVMRMMLEYQKHEHTAFITLTYADEHLPEGGNVSVRDCQLFLKRLRELIAPVKLRYFLCAEYGEKYGRPHYHCIIYGPVDLGVLKRAWTLGFVHLGYFSEQSCGYVVKYMLKASKESRTDGRVKEFRLMSRRPGLGFGAVEDVARVLESKSGSVSVARSGDVPCVLRQAVRLRPLGRYFRGKLRERMGLDKEASAIVDGLRNQALAEELRYPGARLAREELRHAQQLSAEYYYNMRGGR